MNYLSFLCLVFFTCFVHGKELTVDDKLEQLRTKLAKVSSNDTVLVNNLYGLARQLESRSKGYVSYNYMGCYKDYELQRMFRGFAKTDTRYLTNEQCIMTCNALGFVYAGTQAGRDCHCGDSAPEQAYNPAVPDLNCADRCSGNPNQICGGQYMMSVFKTGIEQYRYRGESTIGESTTYSEVKWKFMA